MRLAALMIPFAIVGCGSDSSNPVVDAAPTSDSSVATGDGNVGVDANSNDKFSFFVTSLVTMRAQSGSQDGFGGNLGGLVGADQICQTAAANVGFGHKTWRAFLSTYNNGAPIHAVERIGTGPWYDRNGKLFATDITGLLQTRPNGDAAIKNDLPDENGVPLTALGDSHDILTASDSEGRFEGTSAMNACNDWTSAVGPGTGNLVRCGHAWPAMSGQDWIRAHQLRGCAAGVNLVQNGPGSGDCVGCSGGYGGIYCFALQP
jgi:hypothetical protein